jgi:hypothetical protein
VEEGAIEIGAEAVINRLVLSRMLAASKFSTCPPGLERSPFPCASMRPHVNLNVCAPVAQLDRAAASGAVGREFESLRARHSFT